jgi:hypothetical protein
MPGGGRSAECPGMGIEVEQGVAGGPERPLLWQVADGIHEGADQGALQRGEGAVEPRAGGLGGPGAGRWYARRFPGDVEVERFGQVGGRPVSLGQGIERPAALQGS